MITVTVRELIEALEEMPEDAEVKTNQERLSCEQDVCWIELDENGIVQLHGVY